MRKCLQYIAWICQEPDVSPGTSDVFIRHVAPGLLHSAIIKYEPFGIVKYYMYAYSCRTLTKKVPHIFIDNVPCCAIIMLLVGGGGLRKHVHTNVDIIP